MIVRGTHLHLIDTNYSLYRLQNRAFDLSADPLGTSLAKSVEQQQYDLQVTIRNPLWAIESHPALLMLMISEMMQIANRKSAVKSH